MAFSVANAEVYFEEKFLDGRHFQLLYYSCMTFSRNLDSAGHVYI